MKKYEVIKEICETGVVAIVRAENEEQGIEISKACLAGGIKAVELTFTVPFADEVIKSLVKEFGSSMLIGAGTVLDSETARIAILAGAKYIVSPGFDLETAKLCNRYQVPYMAAGVDIVKLFPGSAFGPSFVKAVKGPLPQANIMPTGGVSLENVDQWIKNGCVAVGVGGDLTAPAKSGDYAAVTEVARQFVEKVANARKN